jgi:ubiquinone/menaquinone biosynthesis C-methylase UbiE
VLIDTVKKYIHKNIFPPAIKEKGVVEAYDIWAENYDSQPGNLMLDLDELLFAELLDTTDIRNKNVADIGCGTGRHWLKLLQKHPTALTGFDVSPGMLNKLKEKFPSAHIHTITDNHFSQVADDVYDVILSTLTVAHIEDIEEAINAWSRILKTKGDVIVTDFHPNALASGGKRTFKHEKSHIAVQNFVHDVAVIKVVFAKNGFTVVNEAEKKVDEKVMHYYHNQDAMHVYEKFKGSPIIYGIHFRRV